MKAERQVTHLQWPPPKPHHSSQEENKTHVNSLMPPETWALPGRMPRDNCRFILHNPRREGPLSSASRNVLAMLSGGLFSHSPPGCIRLQFEAINKADKHVKARFQLPSIELYF